MAQVFEARDGFITKRLKSAFGICRSKLHKAGDYKRRPESFDEIGDLTPQGRRRLREKRKDPERVLLLKKFDRKLNILEERLKRQRNLQ